VRSSAEDFGNGECRRIALLTQEGSFACIHPNTNNPAEYDLGQLWSVAAHNPDSINLSAVDFARFPTPPPVPS